MEKTIPASFIGETAFGYILLAIPSEDTKQRITALLNSLTTELPGVLWPMPPEQMHITLCELTPPRSQLQDAEALYELHRQHYEDITGQILSATPKISVRFDTIAAFPEAIIVRSGAAESFNTIRANLTANLDISDETRKPPRIIHSSIARYLKSVDVEQVRRIVATHSIEIEEEISAFELLRYEALPMQQYKIIKTYPLNASSATIKS